MKNIFVACSAGAYYGLIAHIPNWHKVYKNCMFGDTDSNVSVIYHKARKMPLVSRYTYGDVVSYWRNIKCNI